MTQRIRRRRGRREDRALDDDLLHLLADGPRDQLHNRFSVHRLTPAVARQLWAEHGERILAEWERTGHRPGWYWRTLAEAAGIAVPVSRPGGRTRPASPPAAA